MSRANFRAKVPTLLDRALIGLVILVVLVLLGMQVVSTGPTTATQAAFRTSAP